MNFGTRFALLISFWIFCTVACQPTSTIPIAEIDVSITPKIIRSPTFTVTPFPATTARPKSTVSATKTPTVESTPVFPPEILSKVATLDAISTEKPELWYDKQCIIMDSGCSIMSPNGKWAVFRSVKKGTGGLSIVNITSKTQWDIHYYDITGKSWDDTAVDIEHWSHDGNYLYVSPRPPGDGGEGWFWRGYIQLIRMNLKNGTWVDTKMGAAYSFSPNDRFIVYRRNQNVVIHEFQTGQEQTFTVPAEYVVFGRFTWSSDSKKIIFASSSAEELLSDALLEKPNGFTLFLLNSDGMQVQTILKNDERYLYPIEWITPTSVLLGSLYKVLPDGNLDTNNEQFILNLLTYSISKYGTP